MTTAPTGPIPKLLIEIRGDRSQSEAARIAKQYGAPASQGSISKWEAGERVPKPGPADLYARALGATREQRDDLRELCQAVDDRKVKKQTRLVRGADAQRRILADERRSDHIRSWQCEIVPGLMQTWPYTLLVLERQPDAKWTAVRRERLALVDEPHRLVEQIVSEGVLRTVLGSPAVMAEQLEHLDAMSRRPNVRIGIVPHGRPVLALPPSFHILNDESATNETLAGTAFLAERPDLDSHTKMFDRLRDAAVFDDKARAILRRIRADHREVQ